MRAQTKVVTAEQYAPRRLDPRWGAVVPDSVRPALEACGMQYLVWTCETNPEHQAATRIGCKRPECYPCSSSQSAEDVADRMEIRDVLYGEVGVPVSGSMFTFSPPSDMWPRMDKDPDAVRKGEKLVVKAVSNYFGGEFVSVEGQKRVRRYVVGGEVVGQWFHSFHRAFECRGKECHRCGGRGCKGNVWRGADYHFHLFLDALLYDRQYEVYGLDGLSKGAFVKRTLSLSGGEVRKMCYELGRRFRAAFEAEWGESSASEWIVNYRYYPGRKDVEFCLSYMFRSEVFDAYREVVYNDCAPRTGEEKAWLQRMLSIRKRCQHRYSSFGWMSNAVLNKYGRRVGVQFKPKAERSEDRRRVFCDRCGGEMHAGRYEKTFTFEELASHNIPILIRVGRRDWGG